MKNLTTSQRIHPEAQAPARPGWVPPTWPRNAGEAGPPDSRLLAPSVPLAAQLPPDPSALQLGRNFTAATSRWVAAGLPVVSEPVYQARAAACGACEYWAPKARLGLGKCRAPGCGCTKFKRWLATERCPHPQGPKWPE